MNNLEIFCFTHIPLDNLENLGYKMAGIRRNEFPTQRRFWLQNKISTKPKNFTDLN